MDNLVILITTGLAAAFMAWPRISGALGWRATVTPLASIIGSGFLVLGPILIDSYGRLAPLVMLALCVAAYLFGHAIRFNIATIAGNTPRSELAKSFETLSSWLLSFAYIISVAYYLNLLGAFALRLTPFDSDFAARLLTTAIYLFILLTGWFRGFAALERLEQISVGIKLAIIMGLLTGLVLYFVDRAGQNALLSSPPTLTGWPALTLAFGLLITVQGFETSRYLGDEYDAKTRISSMKHAQWFSSLIYLSYILLLTYVFMPNAENLSETAIIDMMQFIAPILPILLIIAALSAQFSAAVADTSGAGGLIEELTSNRFQPRHAYAVLVAAGLMLTWTMDVFQIIAYASRAFALYYGIQAVIAAIYAHKVKPESFKKWWFVALAVFGLSIAVFGSSIEGA